LLLILQITLGRRKPHKTPEKPIPQVPIRQRTERMS
jgi:hypothetical protein